MISMSMTSGKALLGSEIREWSDAECPLTKNESCGGRSPRSPLRSCFGFYRLLLVSDQRTNP